jgi:hypothetical protein
LFVPQVPPLHVGTLQTGGLGHAVHAPPALPQAFVAVPASQVLPLMQPVQHEPLRQLPPEHAPPLGVSPHVPPLHVGLWHVLAPQALQPFPPLPHAPVALPGWHVLPWVQPVQHAPARHFPPLQVLPSDIGIVPQFPPLHVAFWHAPAVQLLHAVPPLPHCETVFPA